MKNIILSLFAIALMSSSIFGQEDQSKTHKRIIVKKIERQGDERLTDAEIQKLIQIQRKNVDHHLFPRTKLF